MTRKPNPGVIRATLTIIGEMYREIPRTMAIVTFGVLWIVSCIVYGFITKGWSFALWVVGVAVFYVVAKIVGRWAAKGDGIDEP